MKVEALQERVETPSLANLVREALEELDGKRDKAVDRVFYKLKADQKLLRSVVTEAVMFAIAQSAQKGVLQQRHNILRRHEAAQSRGSVVALAEGISNALLDFPLAGGTKLRDAKRGEVMEQVEIYETSAKSMSHKARWLRLIAQAVPDNKTVGSVMQEKRVQELFEESKNAD